MRYIEEEKILDELIECYEIDMDGIDRPSSYPCFIHLHPNACEETVFDVFTKQNLLNLIKRLDA